VAHGRPSTVTSSSHPPAATWRRAWRVSAATFGRPTMRACGLLVARPRLIDQRLRRSPSRLRARGGSSTLDFSADPGRVGHRRGRCPTSAASTVPLPKLFCNFRSPSRRSSGLTVVVTLRPRDASGASRLRVSGANDPAGWPPRREMPRGLTGLDFARREIVLQFFVCRAGGPPSSRVRSWSSSVERVFTASILVPDACASRCGSSSSPRRA